LKSDVIISNFMVSNKRLTYLLSSDLRFQSESDIYSFKQSLIFMLSSEYDIYGFKQRLTLLFQTRDWHLCFHRSLTFKVSIESDIYGFKQETDIYAVIKVW